MTEDTTPRRDPVADRYEASITEAQRELPTPERLAQRDRLTVIDEWADTMMDALRNSDDGNNPFYSDDEDTISLAHQLAEAVVARLNGSSDE